jgi:AcrR family transcriptional regulator
MSERDVRARLIEAAFALFEERGYESTTVDQIADRAGVGRTTFFRTFRSKEDVIFPDHEAVLNSIAAPRSSRSPRRRVWCCCTTSTREPSRLPAIN